MTSPAACGWPDPCPLGTGCRGCMRMEELAAERAAGFAEALEAVAALLETAPCDARRSRQDGYGALLPAGVVSRPERFDEFLERGRAVRLVRQAALLPSLTL